MFPNPFPRGRSIIVNISLYRTSLPSLQSLLSHTLLYASFQLYSLYEFDSYCIYIPSKADWLLGCWDQSSGLISLPVWFVGLPLPPSNSFVKGQFYGIMERGTWADVSLLTLPSSISFHGIQDVLENSMSPSMRWL